jgi:antitoxin ParD1/3/4
MLRTMTLNVRVSGALGDHVAANVGADGLYENVSEYVRDLIRRDISQAEAATFERLKAELAQAFSAPDSQYQTLTADEVIARNQRKSA